MEASQWQTLVALLAPEEMQDLMQHLSPFDIWQISSPQPPGEATVSHQNFLRSYRLYVESLSRGELPPLAELRRQLSTLWVADPSQIALHPVAGGERYLVQQLRPALHLRLATMRIAPEDGKLHTMVHGSDAVHWGIQFAYPQIFQESESGDYLRTPKDGQLFHLLRRWMRSHTSPTAIVLNGKIKKYPIRIGPACFTWIESHPQLTSMRAISVSTESTFRS